MKKKILIVDDSESIREVISVGLQLNGFDVVKGINGKDGLDKLGSENKFDLVITDLNMPVMDGITFLKELRKQNNSMYTPVIILTTESQETKKQEARQAGATAWIVKPFTNEKLINVIKKLML
jgi:two-component system chemotaxis response regulator CheY